MGKKASISFASTEDYDNASFVVVKQRLERFLTALDVTLNEHASPSDSEQPSAQNLHPREFVEFFKVRGVNHPLIDALHLALRYPQRELNDDETLLLAHLMQHGSLEPLEDPFTYVNTDTSGTEELDNVPNNAEAHAPLEHVLEHAPLRKERGSSTLNTFSPEHMEGEDMEAQDEIPDADVVVDDVLNVPEEAPQTLEEVLNSSVSVSPLIFSPSTSTLSVSSLSSSSAHTDAHAHVESAHEAVERNSSIPNPTGRDSPDLLEALSDILSVYNSEGAEPHSQTPSPTSNHALGPEDETMQSSSLRDRAHKSLTDPSTTDLYSPPVRSVMSPPTSPPMSPRKASPAPTQPKTQPATQQDLDAMKNFYGTLALDHDESYFLDRNLIKPGTKEIVAFLEQHGAPAQIELLRLSLQWVKLKALDSSIAPTDKELQHDRPLREYARAQLFNRMVELILSHEQAINIPYAETRHKGYEARLHRDQPANNTNQTCQWRTPSTTPVAPEVFLRALFEEGKESLDEILNFICLRTDPTASDANAALVTHIEQMLRQREVGARLMEKKMQTWPQDRYNSYHESFEELRDMELYGQSLSTGRLITLLEEIHPEAVAIKQFKAVRLLYLQRTDEAIHIVKTMTHEEIGAFKGFLMTLALESCDLYLLYHLVRYEIDRSKTVEPSETSAPLTCCWSSLLYMIEHHPRSPEYESKVRGKVNSSQGEPGAKIYEHLQAALVEAVEYIPDQALRREHVEFLKEFFEQCTAEYLNLGLIVAIRYGFHAELIQAMMEHGADPRAYDSQACLLALKQNNVEALVACLLFGADLHSAEELCEALTLSEYNKDNRYGLLVRMKCETALEQFKHVYENSFERLPTNESLGEKGDEVLFQFARAGHLPMVKLFMAYGAVDHDDKALNAAAARQHDDVVEQLKGYNKAIVRFRG